MKRVFASFVLLALLPGCAVVPAGTPSGAAPVYGASYAQGAPVAPTVYAWPPVRFSFSLGYTHRVMHIMDIADMAVAREEAMHGGDTSAFSDEMRLST